MVLTHHSSIGSCGRDKRWCHNYICIRLPYIQSNLYKEVTFGTKKKWPFKVTSKRGSIHMKFSMTGQEKRWHFNTGDCLIEVTAWTGLTVYVCNTWWSLITQIKFILRYQCHVICPYLDLENLWQPINTINIRTM